MACSVSAIIGALTTGEALFGEVPISELAERVRRAVGDLLGPRETVG